MQKKKSSKMDPSARSICGFVFKLPCTSVESYAHSALCQNNHFISFVWHGDHTYHVPGTRYQVFIQQQHFVLLPLWSTVTAGTPIVLLYQKGDAVRIEPRPPSPSTCRLCASSSRTFCFDPKRAATALACRACLASREHRVGSLSIVGYMIKLRLTSAAV